MTTTTVRLLAALAILVGVGSALTLLYLQGEFRVTRIEDRFAIRGLDVSHHQGKIEWGRVAKSKPAFVYIKATEGQDFVDPRFKENWSGTRRWELPRGAYHFFTFCTPGKAQAEHFLRTVPPDATSLPPAVDVEFVGNCKSWTDLGAVHAELDIFMREVEAAWGVRPVLYVTHDSLTRVVRDSFQEHPLWIRSVRSEPHLAGGREWTIWQYSDRGRVPGIEGRVDRNALPLTAKLEDLRVPIAPAQPGTTPH